MATGLYRLISRTSHLDRTPNLDKRPHLDGWPKPDTGDTVAYGLNSHPTTNCIAIFINLVLALIVAYQYMNEFGVLGGPVCKRCVRRGLAGFGWAPPSLGLDTSLDARRSSSLCAPLSLFCSLALSLFCS